MITYAKNKYNLITGRHRIAAAKYLNSLGELSDDLRVNFPIVSYPWENWIFNFPFPGFDICNQCR